MSIRAVKTIDIDKQDIYYIYIINTHWCAHMGQSNVTTATAVVLKGLAIWASEVFDVGAGARLLFMTTDAFKALAADPAALPDISLSEAGRLLPLLAEFAWKGEWYGNDISLSEALTEVSPLCEVLGTNFMDAFGEPLLPDDAKALIDRVVTAAHARFSLHQAEDIDVQGLAALAQVSEKTVRMAANPKLPDHLKTESGPGNRTYISAGMALAWLRERKDFRETRFDLGKSEQPSIQSVEDLAALCAMFRKRAGLTIDELRKALKWKASEALAYQNLENGVLRPESSLFTIVELWKLSHVLMFVDPKEFCRDATRIVVNAAARQKIESRLAELEAQA